MNEAPATPIPRFSTRAKGITLAALAAAFASSAGVLLRHVESADAWTILFYRSLGFTLTVLLYIFVCHRRSTVRRFAEVGWPGLFVAFSLGGAFLAFVLAMIQTNVATVVAVLSVAPLVAGLLAWIALGERPSFLAWLAMLAAFAGVSLVVRDGIAAGSGEGLVFSVLACLGYAGAIVGLRAGHRRDMAPAVCLSGVMACVASLFMVGGVAISFHDLAVSLLLGTVQIGAQYILLTIATRFTTAADIALVMILEVVLAPLWVWLLVGETVPVMVLYGGVVIIAALIVNAAAPETTEVEPQAP